MKYKFSSALVLWFSLLLFSACTTGEESYYVSPSGDDGNKGSFNQPWKTIAYAASQVHAGTLHVMAGVYEEAVTFTHSGTPDHYIVVLGEEGAILDGSFGYNYPGKGLLTVQDASYVTVDGITVRDVLTHGIMVQGACHHIRIRNCRTERTKGGGIYIYGEWPFSGYYISDVTVEHNEVHWPNEGFWDGYNIWEDAIALSGGIENFEVSHNYINAYDSVNYRDGPSGISVKAGVKNGIIHHNIIDNVPSNGVIVNSDDIEAIHIDLYQNLIRRVTGYGIAIAALEGGRLDDINVFNNLVTGSGTAAIACGDYNSSDKPTQSKTSINIFNNTLYRAGETGNREWDGYGIWTEKLFSGKIYNNIITGSKHEGMKLGHPGRDVTNNCLFNNNTANTENSGSTGNNAVIGDPLFLDPANDDFSLKSTSICIDVGISEGAPAFDINDSIRPSGRGFDIGAYEFSFKPPDK